MVQNVALRGTETVQDSHAIARGCRDHPRCPYNTSCILSVSHRSVDMNFPVHNHLKLGRFPSRATVGRIGNRASAASTISSLRSVPSVISGNYSGGTQPIALLAHVRTTTYIGTRKEIRPDLIHGRSFGPPDQRHRQFRPRPRLIRHPTEADSASWPVVMPPAVAERTDLHGSCSADTNCQRVRVVRNLTVDLGCCLRGVQATLRRGRGMQSCFGLEHDFQQRGQALGRERSTW
jgi:hypothetical protein